MSQDILNDAFKIKSSFLFVARISQVYTEISSEFIRPGLAEVEEIGLSDDSVTDEQMGLKQGKLNDYKRVSKAGVKAMTQAVSSFLASSSCVFWANTNLLLETESVARGTGRPRTQKRHIIDSGLIFAQDRSAKNVF